MDGWGYAGMGLGMLLFWGLVIAGLVLLIRFTLTERDRTPPPSDAPRAEDVLAQRYARGEIDDKEYAQRLATLRAHIAPR